MMDPDTTIGGPSAVFPVTGYAVIMASSSSDPAACKRALDLLVAAYWKPIYKYIRIKKGEGNENAKDLTQAFFARALEKRYFERYDPAKARFRTYLRVCVDGFLSKERKSAGRGKRGGDRQFFSLDFENTDGDGHGQHVVDRIDPDELFYREWVRGLFGFAVEELRQLCLASDKNLDFALFQRYDLEGPEASHKPTYAQVAEEFGLTVTQVTNYLARARRQFRQLVIERIRVTAGSEEEFRSDVRRLLGGALS
jgi:RNA polymerase sigma factor (sigma-70 family)